MERLNLVMSSCCDTGWAAEKWRPFAANQRCGRSRLDNRGSGECSATVWYPCAAHRCAECRHYAWCYRPRCSGNSRQSPGRAPDVRQSSDGFLTAFVWRRSRRVSRQSAVVTSRNSLLSINPFIGTLKPQSNGPLYSNMVIRTLAVDQWAVIFGTARRGLGGLARCTKCNSSPINGQCTNFMLFDVAL